MDPVKEILFMGYGPTQTRLISLIESRGVVVKWTDQPMTDLSPFDLTISFGYRHILPLKVLQTSKRPPLNLHIAYLPFNRGAHPLFWAAMEGTPNGVTIHEIDEGIDTGPICYQRKVDFDYSKETFKNAHRKLIERIERLFEDHMEGLIKGMHPSYFSPFKGSYHRSSQLPSGFSWDALIGPTISKLKETVCPS